MSITGLYSIFFFWVVSVVLISKSLASKGDALRAEIKASGSLAAPHLKKEISSAASEEAHRRREGEAKDALAWSECCAGDGAGE